MNNFFQIINSLFPVSFLKNMTPFKVIFPFYHCVSPKLPKHFYKLYPIKSVNEFKKDLDFLLKYFQPISFDDFYSYSIGEKDIKNNSFFLSFDDGLSQIYDIVAPILYEKGIEAAFFINSDFVDNKEMFYRYKYSLLRYNIEKNNLNISELERFLKTEDLYQNSLLNSINGNAEINIQATDFIAGKIGLDFNEYMKNEKPYMTSDQIMALSKKGFLIGAHSKNHPLYTNLSTKEQIEQTVDSVNCVVDNFNPKFKLFAFPFTDDGVKNDFFDEIFNNKIVDFTFGTAGMKDDFYKKNIQRIPVENGFSAKQNVKYQSLIYPIKKVLGRNIVKR